MTVVDPKPESPVAPRPREDISFYSRGVRCAAWLYRPERKNPPLIVMCHGLGAIKEMRLDAIAERFAAAGFAVLVFDYRFFGASDGQPRQLLTLRNQHDDIHAALTFARTLEGVDRNRIALWGTSLGGGNVLQVGSEDPKVAAVVAQCPFTSGLSSSLAISPISAIGVTMFAIVDAFVRLFTNKTLLVPLIGTPGMPAMMTAPDVVEGAMQLMPTGSILTRRLSRYYRRYAAKRMQLPPDVSLTETPECIPSARLYGMIETPGGGKMVNGISARFGIEIAFARPGSAMRKLQCPTLVCVCDRDSVAPAKPTIRMAKKAKHVELRHYDANHFDIYVGPRFEEVIADQITFFTRQLGSI